MDMRTEIRYRLEAPAIFSWDNFQGKRLHGEGITRDISLLGAFIFTPTCPPNLASLRVELALPSLIGTNAEIRIVGQVRVVRVEHRRGNAGENGFAVVRSDMCNWNLVTDQNETLWRNELLAAGGTSSARPVNRSGFQNVYLWPKQCQ